MKQFKKKLLIAASISVLASPSAYAQFEFIADFTKAFRDLVTEAIGSNKQPPQQPNHRPDPFRYVVGNWYSNNAIITSTSYDPENIKYNYKWTGQIRGRVNQIGEYIFKAENGCQITGKSIADGSEAMWTMITKTTNCPVDYLNNAMFGRISREGNVFTLQIKDSPLATDRKMMFLMEAVLQSY